MRRSYSPAQKAEVIIALNSGLTKREAAAKFEMPEGTVATLQAVSKAIVDVRDYKVEIERRVQQYADACFDTLESQVRTLGDRAYLEAHGADVFAVSQSHRIVGEQLARFLAAAYG